MCLRVSAALAAGPRNRPRDAVNALHGCSDVRGKVTLSAPSGAVTFSGTRLSSHTLAHCRPDDKPAANPRQARLTRFLQGPGPSRASMP
ncbi:hypothetical protein D8I24_4781 [Cupriavidus necator H850]|nr:hypothetical protein D8I24_4781 [Cupriavidus necator H850]